MKYGIVFLLLSLSAFAKVQVAPKNETPWLKNLRRVTKIFRQADAVAREMWWIAANDRRGLGQSPFGRLQRALIKETGGKLPQGISFRCDTYKVSRLGAGSPLKVEVYEACPSRKTLLLATWMLDRNDNIEVDFYPINLADDLGLASSIMNKKTRCNLKFTGSTLQVMDCKDWAQDRGKNQVIDLSIFKYTADQDSVLEIKGVVLEGLNPKSKIESKVPLKGRIIVTEIENEEEKLPAKPDGLKPPPPVASPLVKKSAPADMPGAQIPQTPAENDPILEGRDPAIPMEPPVRRRLKKPSAEESLPNPEYIEGEDLGAPSNEGPVNNGGSVR